MAARSCRAPPPASTPACCTLRGVCGVHAARAGAPGAGSPVAALRLPPGGVWGRPTCRGKGADTQVSVFDAVA